ncbi:hypothetical protein MTO98_15815 [Mucilaginibacter sp. SMC90]|uniref:hypothetical protein n=1 Tax=Mucilaginibacter sp. SMC90 TaxID=2929803 RepID=UPI001FB378F5|nr:hypothetical protein [Mucilaginibacter sp. SMC90]UOE52543.1 hypothetical protein MTO98_15815 [Mucilaginibacter sp. SMC90]
MENAFDTNALLPVWEAIGKSNPWIAQANDPAFDRTLLKQVDDLTQLELLFQYGNWCLGQGFYYQNLCFINQVDGGDEWLTIKDDYAFESITFSRIIGDGKFTEYIDRLLNATKEQCINLTY